MDTVRLFVKTTKLHPMLDRDGYYILGPNKRNKFWWVHDFEGTYEISAEVFPSAQDAYVNLLSQIGDAYVGLPCAVDRVVEGAGLQIQCGKSPA